MAASDSHTALARNRWQVGQWAVGHIGADLLDSDAVTMPPVGLDHVACGPVKGHVVPTERAWAALMASAAGDTAPRAEFTMDKMDAAG